MKYFWMYVSSLSLSLTSQPQAPVKHSDMFHTLLLTSSWTQHMSCIAMTVGF